MRYLILLILFPLISNATESIINEKGIVKNKGLFTTYYSVKDDKMYMEVINLDSNFLYVSSLSQGLGNNDLFLDRGQIRDSRIVYFKKAGNKLLLIQPNLKYRAITTNELERKSVEEAFAKSVLFGFEILERTKNGFIIDITSFLMQDTHGVIDVLESNKQGAYSLDLSKSALNLEGTKSFPKNVDFDVLLTLTGSPEKYEIRSVTPDAKYVTVYQHHSFVELPDNNFKPRIAHPNSGSITESFMNYSAAIQDEMEVKYSWRHRLEKKDPKAEKSEAVEPIIYYLDNGTPEPVRSALMEGAGWWNQAFENIGYIDAFQVKILPDSIDPLDVRYNVIQWVHRSTRGWSYGGGVVDPRTGEIIKGHVNLGSLRVRQDFKIAKALTNNSNEDEMIEFALARIRQLGAHEVGHSLGFAHNFAASLRNRESVMDYPHPLVSIKNDKIDISKAYAVGIGEWDKVALAYSYSNFDENEEEELAKIIKDAKDKGHRFVTDDDSRPIGGSNAYGHLWDNGSNPIDELENVIQIRNLAISQFNLDVINEGESFGELEDLFVLLYYYHRYQTEATIKLIGGREYEFAIKGAVTIPSKPVGEEEQRRALSKVLKTLEADFLMIPKEKLTLFPDRSYKRGRESFKGQMDPSFDPLTAAQSAADFVLFRLFNPERVNRLVSQSAIDPGQLSLEQVLNMVIESSLMKKSDNQYELQVQNSINQAVISRLMILAQTDNVLPQAKAIINSKILGYQKSLEKIKRPSVYEQQHLRELKIYFENPKSIKQAEPVKVPDGSPIGSFSCE